MCKVQTRCVDTSYTRSVFQSGSCQYYCSNVPRLPLSYYYYYNQKDERVSQVTKDALSDIGGVGQTSTFMMLRIKYLSIQSVERVHDYVWM